MPCPGDDGVDDGSGAVGGGVLVLISVLIVLLFGLSTGLVNDGVFGLRSMPTKTFAFDEGAMTDNAFAAPLWPTTVNPASAPSTTSRSP